MKIWCGVMVFVSSAALTVAGNHVPYPKENVAGFVMEKLDITTLPEAIRPKRAKGKKTFSDYGYTAHQNDSKDSFVEAGASGEEIDVRILARETAGIYVCVSNAGNDESNEKFQRTLLLKLKDSSGLLRSRESSKEFGGCPGIGGTDEGKTSYY
jgi:hypothetical protein